MGDDIDLGESDPYAAVVEDTDDGGFLDTFEAIALGAQQTVSDIVGTVADSARDVALGGQGAVVAVSGNLSGAAGEVSGNVAGALNPFNLAGAAFGGTIGIVAVGAVAAVAADQVFFGGVGTASVAKRLFGRR